MGATQDEKKWACEVHRQVADYAKQADICVVLEPLNRFECYFMNTLEEAGNYARMVNHSHLKIMCDTFHAHIEEKDVVQALTANKDVIAHIHISENDRGTPGLGQINFGQIISTLVANGYDNWLTIEAFGQALPEIAAATRVWRTFFPPQKRFIKWGIKLLRIVY